MYLFQHKTSKFDERAQDVKKHVTKRKQTVFILSHQTKILENFRFLLCLAQGSHGF